MMKHESKAIAGTVARTVVINLAVNYLGNIIMSGVGKAENHLRRRRHPLGFNTKGRK